MGGVGGIHGVRLHRPPAHAAGTPAATASPCVVAITDYSFHPNVVAPGAPTTLTLAARNCTGTTLRTTLTQYGHEPPGCPVIDPLPTPVTFAPHGVFTRSTPMTAPHCTGVEAMTVTFTDSRGHLLATATAQLTVVAVPPCTIIRHADTGKTFLMNQQSCDLLELTDTQGIYWEAPTVSGDSITLQPLPIASPVAGQFWRIVPDDLGDSTITALGHPVCPVPGCPTYVVVFQVKIRVLPSPNGRAPDLYGTF